MIKVPASWIRYTQEPMDPMAYTQKMDKIYTRFASAYDGFMIVFPLWKKWLRSVLPYVQGKKILEVSFGPGYLLGELPEDLEIHGLDFNKTMVKRAKVKMAKAGKDVQLIQGNVGDMPYPDDSFDTLINTMAFSGYPDGKKAMEEMLRVLKPDGVLLILDYDYPTDRNICGYLFVKLIEKSGDIIRDIQSLAAESGSTCTRTKIGGCGSVHLFRIEKTSDTF